MRTSKGRDLKQKKGTFWKSQGPRVRKQSSTYTKKNNCLHKEQKIRGSLGLQNPLKKHWRENKNCQLASTTNRRKNTWWILEWNSSRIIYTQDTSFSQTPGTSPRGLFSGTIIRMHDVAWARQSNFTQTLNFCQNGIQLKWGSFFDKEDQIWTTCTIKNSLRLLLTELELKALAH